jgi:hypothetical protein
MKRLWLPLAVLLLLVGCSSSETPQPAVAPSPPPRKPPPQVSKPPARVVYTPAELAKLYPERTARPDRDGFDLPLVINLDAPEVPPEIYRPSPLVEQKPPVEQKPEPPKEKPNPLRLLR